MDFTTSQSSLFFRAPEDVLLLLKDGFNPHETTNGGQTLVHAYLGYPEVVAALLDAGCTTEGSTVMECMRPLHLARDEDVVRLLLEHGGYVQALDYLGRSPLHHAAIQGNAMKVALLLEFDAQVNASDRSGATPLHLAQTRETADLLLDAGADGDALDGWDNRTFESFHRPSEDGAKLNQHIHHRWLGILAERQDNHLSRYGAHLRGSYRSARL